MNEIKVVGWISYDEATKHKESAGGMGGWFNWKVKGMRWKDYIETIKPEYVPYYEAIRHEVVSKNLRITGEQHQDDYAPLFSDDTTGLFSYRGWGDLMAAIWSEAENKDYTYMDFYM